MELSRRRLMYGGGAAIGISAFGTTVALSQAKPKVVVVGGGPGGATAAKYVARDSKGASEVTLVEPAK